MFEILIVDDERVIRAALKALLESEGYVVRVARNGEDALASFREARPDLVLMDVMMPGMNGFDVCKKIRRLDEKVPVAFLTAKDDDASGLRGFGSGGDDFISKATCEELLLARIRRLIGRASLPRFTAAKKKTIEIGSVTVDLTCFAVVEAGRQIARLTKTEADILRLLDSDRGSPFSVDELIDGLRGDGYACEDAMVYVHVSHLRHKLGRASAMIGSTRGSGYRLVK